jgi:hypothetical protein
MFKSRFKIYDEDDFEITPYINHKDLCELIRDIITFHAEEAQPTRTAYTIVNRYSNAFSDIKSDVRSKVK